MDEINRLEPYFGNRFATDGIYDMPLIKRQPIDLVNLRLIRFSAIVKEETEDIDATVHFFEYDDRFDEVWKKPSAYLDELGQYKQVMSPDFSILPNMPLALQIFNTFRTRWLGAYWQENGLTVIPTISWGDDWSFDFCFDGVQIGSCVAVSTLGCRDAKKPFMNGFSMLCKAIDPGIVVCYGDSFTEMHDCADIIEVPYLRNERVAPAKERGT